jgi:hypothetical protein
VTRAREAVIAVEVVRVVAVLAAKTSTQEAAAVWDNATLYVKDAEYWVVLVESEAQERVSRVEAENGAALTSAHEDAEGFV